MQIIVGIIVTLGIGAAQAWIARWMEATNPISTMCCNAVTLGIVLLIANIPVKPVHK